MNLVINRNLKVFFKIRKYLNKLYLFCILLLFVQCTPSNSPEVGYGSIDIYIENVNILDGSGNEPFMGNIAIVDDQIIYVSEEPIEYEHAARIIDGKGRYLAPGFIDLHSHGDPSKTPQFHNFIAMGVTTITLGQDGSGPAVQDLHSWQEEQPSTGPNIAMFVGHGTLRTLAGTGNKVSPSEEEMYKMKTLLNDNLKYAFGMSTGLEYNPGLYAENAELIELARIIGENGRIISSHIRNEDDEYLIGSIEELIKQGRHCPVHISHLKSVFGEGRERAAEILTFIKDARTQGIEITADVYPYTASYTGIGLIFPEWAKTSEQFETAKVERRKELEDYLRKKVKSRNGPEATLLGTNPYKGKTLADLEKEMDIPFEKILIDSIGPQGASAAYFVMDDELQEKLITDTLIAISSDGSPTGFHPRGHGSFARIIEEFVQQRKVLTLPEAVRKMTSYPADILGIEDRGRIAENMKADLILFDPDEVKETATYTDPFQLAEGFDMVIINGKIIREEGIFHDVLPGKFLLP